MKICLIGEGAQGETHMKALSAIEDVEVVTVAGGVQEDLELFAEKWKIPHASLDLTECLNQPGVEAVINGGPSQLHFEQTKLALEHNKHVLLEIPMSLNLADARELTELASQAGLTGMVCHTSRYGAPVLELKRKIKAGELHCHHMVFQTYFFRRENFNRFGKPRTWTDNLLWHHACHAIDMVAWLLDDEDFDIWGQVGPNHSQLGIPMDLTVGMKSKQSGTLATIAHSFNNHGPISLPIRFICEEETYLFEAGVLKNHEGEEIMRTSMRESVLRQNKEFFDAIKSGREAESSFSNCLKALTLLDEVQSVIDKNL